MTDQQFAQLLLHLRIIVVLLGVMAGVLIYIAWNPIF